ncbi:VRR-NUC domain-containing protein [Candidatus Symbiopectobacterium sp.]|uniref:VRR-NUC domain-containing protein n=1 Tax=Candidatus Symbiopectobacterium sp. TaxID=2816440 RepID=UPI0025C6D0BB|nr:VRR-NUC domain-containing protein [Candidatus Symbiopectobacterium sp.]
MAYIRESTIEKHLVAEVKKAGGIAYKFVSPGRRGVPDRLVLLPDGKVLFVECKAPGQKARTAQQREHNQLRVLGFTVVVLNRKMTEKFMEDL